MAVTRGGRDRRGVSGKKAFQVFLRRMAVSGTGFTAEGRPKGLGETLMGEYILCGYKLGAHQRRRHHKRKPHGPCSNLTWNEAEHEWVSKNGDRRPTLGRRTRLVTQEEAPAPQELAA